MRKAIRFLDAVPDRRGGRPGVGRGSRWIAFELPGLPAPRFAGVEVLWFEGATPTGAIPVEQEIKRPAPPRLGTPPYAMVSVARRDPSLTPADFAERWRAEAGNLGGEVIPDEVRGLAYVQDHPTGDDPPYDAVNEVWFDDLDSLVRRAEWFAARPVPDLFVDAFALYLRDPVTF
jgi:hypothetical protein